jgi:hypothetical protein
MEKNQNTKKEKTEMFNILGTFSVLVKSNKSKKHLEKIICKNAPHVRNMIIILREKLYKNKENDEISKEVYQYFCSSRVLREAIFDREGQKNKDKIKKINQYFKNESIWKSLKSFSQSYLDAKSVFSIIQELNKNYNESFKRLVEYHENKEKYFEKYKTKGKPSLPKTKKLKQINHASLMLDGERWSCKTKKINKVKYNFIRIKLGYKAIEVPMNFEHFPIPESCVLRSLNVSHSNGSIYLNFSYGKMEKITKKATKPKKQKRQKIAGMDLGLKLLFSIFINDKKSKSFAFSNKKMIAKNAAFNRLIAKVDKSISKEAIKFKEESRKVKDINNYYIFDADGNHIEETVKIATEWTNRGLELKSYKRFLFEKRNRFFKSEYEKISTHLANKLIKMNVTDLVLSKNLSFLKIQQNKQKMHKKTQQKFYQIPLGGFLNMLERKLKNRINLHFIDESHTSKTSCLSKDINKIKLLREKSEKSLSTNDYGGSRVKRGFFRDYKTNILFHADINGAINHIKVKFGKLKFSWLKNYKQKICNPIVLDKSENFAIL